MSRYTAFITVYWLFFVILEITIWQQEVKQ
nr:MAG TPA: hypothetical protein [Caudoviricetes sp.]